MSFSERMEMRGQQGGFTLIELLVVIAILAILGGVAVFAVGNLTEVADEGACEVEKNTVIVAANAAIAKDGDDTNFADYLDGTPKYWTYTATGTGVAADPVGAGDNAGNAICS